MKTLTEIKRLLRDRRPGVVGKATGLTPLTISLVRDGKSSNPEHNTIRLLSEYFEAQENDR